MAQTERAPALESGWRPILNWLIDINLLKEEGHRGLSIDCLDCGQVHAFDTSDLLSMASSITPQRTGQEPQPDGYPSVDRAAFAEIWGRLTPEALDEPEPQITIIAPQHREATYRERFAEQPMALSHLTLVAGYKQRIDTDTGHVTSIGAPPNETHRVAE